MKITKYNKAYPIGKFQKEEFTIAIDRNSFDFVNGEVNGYFGLHIGENSELVMTHLPTGRRVVRSNYKLLSLNSPNPKSYKLPVKKELKELFELLISKLNMLDFVDDVNLMSNGEGLKSITKIMKEILYK